MQKIILLIVLCLTMPVFGASGSIEFLAPDSVQLDYGNVMFFNENTEVKIRGHYSLEKEWGVDFVEKGLFDKSDTTPWLKAFNTFQVNASGLDEPQCQFYLIQESNGKRILLKNGLNEVSVSGPTDVLLTVDADIFTTCYVQLDYSDKRFVASISFLTPLDLLAQDYIDLVSYPCPENAENICVDLPATGERLDLTKCLADGVPFETCLAGEEAILRYRIVNLEGRHEYDANKIAELEATQAEDKLIEIEAAQQNILGQIALAESRRGQDQGNWNWLLGLIVVLVVLSFLIVQRYKGVTPRDVKGSLARVKDWALKRDSPKDLNEAVEEFENTERFKEMPKV